MVRNNRAEWNAAQCESKVRRSQRRIVSSLPEAPLNLPLLDD